MMKHIAFLTATLFTSCSIQSMDKVPEYLIPQAIVTHMRDVNKLHNKTREMLEKFKDNYKKSADSLVSIIQETNALNITPKELGFFFLHQEQSLGNSIKSTLLSHADISPFHISVFFELLNNYNTSLKTEDLDSPTSAQIRHHLKNTRVDATVDTCSTIGIGIPANTLSAVKIPILSSVALSQFNTLVEHINAILQRTPQDMKRAARLIYYDAMMSQSPLTSSTK